MKFVYDDEVEAKPSSGMKFAYDDGGNSFGPKSGVLRQAADIPIGLASGVADLVNAGVGLGDIATGGAAGDAVDAAGSLADKISLPDALRPTRWADKIQSYYTPEMKAAKAASHQSAAEAAQRAKDDGEDWKGQIGAGFLGGLKGVVENPRAGMSFITENVGGMKAIAKGTEKVLAKYLPEIDAAVKAGTMTQAQANARVADLAGKISPVGEGILTAGQGASQVREENPNATASDYLMQAPAGFITGAIARGVGKIPGLENVESTMALNALNRKSGFTGDVAKRLGKGFLSEGVLQEVPQSAQEQAWVNAATGKPLHEGVGEAAAHGLIAGGTIGAGAAGMSGVYDRLRAGAQGAGQAGAPGQTTQESATDQSAQSLVAEALAAEQAAEAANQSNAPAGIDPLAAPSSQTNQAGAAGAPTTQGETPNGDQTKVTITSEAGQQEGGEASIPDTGRANQPAEGGGDVPAGAGRQVASPEAQKTESRAEFYDRLALEREQPGPAADAARAAQYRAKAAVLRAKAIASDVTTPAQPTTGGVLPQQPTTLDVPSSPSGTGGATTTSNGWQAFPASSETLGVPRAEMPQIKAEHRGALVNFLAARGVAHSTEEVAADSLRPTQAEFSPKKIRKAAAFSGGDRSILVSSDGRVLDGHHQWMARLSDGKPVKIIRLDAPIARLIDLAHEFPSSTTAKASGNPAGASVIRSKQSPIMRRDDLVGAIMRVTGGDGIHSSMAQDTTGDTANRASKLRGLFTNLGTQDLGEVAMLLREQEGYDVRDGSHLSELVRNAAAGDVAVSMERQQRDADAARDRQYRDRIRAKAKKLGVRTVGVKFSDVDAAVLEAERTRLDAVIEKLSARDQRRFAAAVAQLEAIVSDAELQSILQSIDDLGLSGREKWREGLRMLRGFAADAEYERAQGVIEDAEATSEEPDWFKDFDEGPDSGTGATGGSVASDGAAEEAGSGQEQGGGHRQPGPVRGGSEASGQGDGQEAGLELAGQTLPDIDRQEAERVAAEKVAQEPAAKPAEAPKPVASFTNDDTKMTAFVHRGRNGKFNATLRDDESGEYVPSARAGIATVEAATKIAKEMAGLPADEGGKFDNNGDALNDAQRELRSLSHDKDGPGDVALGSGKFVSFDAAVRLAREGIESGAVRPFPAQLNFLLDLTMRDADRVLAAATAKPAESPAQSAKPEPIADPVEPKPAVSANTIFTESAADAARALLKRKLGQMNAGIDPEIMQAGITLAGYHIEKGARTFAAYTAAMVGELGDVVRPYLKSWYMGVKFDPRASGLEGMDSSATVEAAGVDEAKAGPAVYDETGESQKGEGGDRTAEIEGGGALAPVVADEVGGTGEGGPGGRGTVESSQGGGEGNTATDAGRGEAPRSGGNGSAGTHPADAGGAGPGPGGGGAAGVGGNGSEVSGGLRGAGPRGRITDANFEIGEDVGLGDGGQAAKYKDNVAAIKVLKAIEADRRRATAEEKKVLARYVGWGGIPNAFRNRVSGEIKPEWSRQVAELEGLLTKDELRAASASTRNAHFTSKEVVGFMWQAARRLGFNGGMVLEPSVGTGNFVGLMPREVAGKSLVTGIELDSLTSRMARSLYPRSNIVHSGFEKLSLPDGGFSLAIGNPPFGPESLPFQHRPDLNSFSIHNQFFLGSIDAVEPGGLMAMVVSRYLLDAQDSSARRLLAQKAKLVGSVRLPGSAFKGNALTEVVTDVIFFQRRTAEEEARVSSAVHEATAKAKAGDVSAQARKAAAETLLRQEMGWTGTAKVKDPLGGEAMEVGAYFADNPQMVVGTMDRSGSMQHGADIGVKLAKGEKLADRLAEALERLPSREPREFSDEALARSEEMHAALGEALELSAAGAELGSLRFGDDGSLSKVIERVGDKGESALKKVAVNEATPWSPNLQMDMKGRWYVNVPKLKADGTPMKNGRFVVYTKEIYENEADVPASLRLGGPRFERLKKLVAIRDLFVAQINLEVGRSDSKKMEAHRAKLRQAYDSFVKAHGYISENKNASIVSEMPDEGLLLSLESDFRPAITAARAKASGVKQAPARANPSAILSRPVAVPPEAASSAASAADALAISMSESGRVSLSRIADLLDVSQDEAKAQLTAGDSPLAFADPEQSGEIVERNDYLSGSVRRKLEAAKDAGLAANVAALEKVQPELWASDNVNPRIGANWIPTQVYSEFAGSLIGSKVRVAYSELTNTFDITGESDSAASTATWGTSRVAFPELFANMLNSARTAVYDKDADGKRTFNQTETDNASDKKREITEAFDEWVFKDAKRRQDLTQLFNDRFNTRVNRQYDGSHLAMPGKVPDAILSLRRSQKNGAWRGIIENAVLYDHAVGAGKTFTAIARAMERRRMGISKKPMIVVPNHMVQEWSTQAYRLYPGAKILAAGTKDLSAKNRRRLFAKIASGDWDAVIVPHSSFGFISVSPATEERFLNEQIELANAALKEAEADADPGARSKPLSVKAAEALVEKLEKRIAQVRDATRDKLLTFEQMGVDDLTIDESHEFKNLFYSTRMTDVRGLGPAAGSNKALDMYTKVRLVREMNGGIAFLSGTPISNSAVEMYTLMRYLAPDALEDAGLEHFDAFRSQFVNAVPELEPTDSGVGLKMVTRLGRSWSNMRSLMEAYYSVADVVTNDDIKAWYAEDNPGQEFPLPKVKGGDRRTVAVDPTPTQLAILMEVVNSFDTLKNIQNPKERNKERLRLMDRARKLSLHAKAVDQSINDEPGGKLDRAVGEVSAIFHKWTKDKGTQLVFLDRGLPKGSGDAAIIKEFDALQAASSEALASGNEAAYGKVQDKLAKFDENEIGELRAAQSGGWNAYQHIKDGLVAKGVPANTIAFIQDHHTDAAKKRLFEAVKDGSIRVLIGSTPRMGAGMNVQERLVALHHIDVTWKPSDIEQREGRIIRQGNALLDKYGNSFEVEILAYVTERTVDSKLWALNSMKLKMVNGIRYYDGQFEMDFEDEAAVGMAETAALASGDPLLLERFRLQSEVDMLLRQKKSHSRRRQSAEDSIESARRIAGNEKWRLDKLAEDAKSFDAAKAVIDADQATRKIEINGVAFGPFDHYGANKAIADATAALVDGEKLSMVIDGKTITTKGAAEAAVIAALGDSTPFVSEAGGKRIIARSDFARAIRGVIGHEFKETPESAIGSIAGIPVVLSAAVSGFNDSKIVTLESAEGHAARISESVDISPGGSAIERAKPALVTVQNMRQLVAEFEKGLARMKRDKVMERLIVDQAKKARDSIPVLEAVLSEPFKKAEELDQKKARLEEVENELDGRTSDSAASKDQPDGLSNADDGAVGNLAVAANISPADSAVYDMAGEGKGAAEILDFISKGSRHRFNRYLARALKNLGVSSSVALDSQGGWKFNKGKAGAKYAAAYNQRTDAVALFTPRDAERHVLHELVHAATLKAIAKGGPAATQMKSLFESLQSSPALAGQYGMENLDEFVAEAFSNPLFQQALKKAPAPRGSSLKSAWQTFVRMVARVLGFKSPAQETALDRAMVLGAELMRENSQLAGNVRGGLTSGVRGPSTTTPNRFNQADDGNVSGNVSGNIEPDEYIDRASSIIEIHGVKNAAKADAMAKRMAETEQWEGRPILAYRDASGAVFSLTGSHRLAAAQKAGIPVPVVFVDDAATEFENSKGEFLADVAGSGDDRVVDFLNEAGDKRAAELMDAEITAANAPKDTITIDGVERPRMNSNGKPIAQTDEALRKFYAWFKNSKVTDDQGRPLVIYHGTNSDFSAFSPAKAREDINVFASSSRRTASDFALYRSTWTGANVMPLYANTAKLLVIDGRGRPIRGVESMPHHARLVEEMEDGEHIRDFAKRSGYDGILFKNVVDDAMGPNAPLPSDVYALFDNAQIKSATGNTGEFSPDNPDIRFNIAGNQGVSYAGGAGGTITRTVTNASGQVVATTTLSKGKSPWQFAKAKAAALLAPGSLDKVIYELQDKYIDLRRLRDHIKAIGGVITDMNDAYLGEELYHKRLAHRVETFAADEVQPLMAEMRNQGVATEELETFLHARHAPEANAEMAKRNPNQSEIAAGHQAAKVVVTQLENQLQRAQKAGTATAAIEKALNTARGELADWNGAQAFQGTEDERLSLSGMSDADAAAHMASLSPAKRKALDALAARVDAINEATMQTLDDYGLMSKDALRSWKATYKHYIPLHRDEAHPDSNSHPIGQGFNTKGDAAKRRTGSNAKVTNILGHIAMQRESALTRGEKNHVMLKLYLMARQNPMKDVWEVGAVPTTDVIDRATGFVRTIPDPLYKNRPNVVMLRVAGKDVAIVMNENNPEALRMAHALKNLDVDDLHYLIPVVGKVTRYFAAINTQYNPIFGLVNLMRDTQEAALNLSTTPIAGKQGEVLRSTLGILKEVLKNGGRMPKTGQWADLFNELREVGGTTGFRDLFLDAESRSKALLSEMKALDRGNAAKAWNSVKNWLSDYNEAMENATRLAAYKAARDSGMSKERAASLAKNLTVNFNRKGRQTRELGALYAFFNAAVQGTTRMVQTLAGPAGRKIMAGGVMLGAMNTLIGFAAMGGGDDGDDEWSKIPEFIKERSIIIPIGKQDYITIPMPLGFQFLPNIGRLVTEMAIYKDKTAGKQMASLFSVLADAFNPLGGSSPPLQLISPTVMDPFVALAQNKDWTGRPIYRENRSGLDPDPGFVRSKDSATPIAKGVAEAINFLTGGTQYTPGGWSPTPDQLDYVFGQLTGGVGREIGKATSTVAAPFTGEELPAYKIPLVGRLYGNTSGASGESQKFYENVTRANEAENEIKGRLKAGLSVTEFLQDNPTAMALAASGNAAERQARLLRSVRRGIVEQDPPDKVAKVREINEQIAAVMRGFNRSSAAQ